jgi:phage tail sheath protein FI
MEDRFAILDGDDVEDGVDPAKIFPVDKDGKGYGAVYFPYIRVRSQVWIKDSKSYKEEEIDLPPSGHIAGIYARVDRDRGVYKAPANEEIRGASGVKHAVTRSDQGSLNDVGINVIRQFNGNIKVWGARTISDSSSEYKYINVRRTMLFLRQSIDESTQWAVFEPNNPALWQKIKRNVSDFLTVQWRSGALFGNTVQEAFYVKCDAETNPPEERNLGRVNAVVGVAIVKPAEFIIFSISQTTAPN